MMGRLISLLATGAITWATLVRGSPVSNALDESSHAPTARSSQNASDPLVVDLGYALYNGTANSTTKLNSWLGMRFAQDTTQFRWQRPQAPLTNRSTVIQANAFGPQCPTGSISPFESEYNYSGSEDCLFLSVVSPEGATNLPVLIWIHGGGYNQGEGNQDLTQLLAASGNAFIGVDIQYRLAAFGFLASDDVQQHGIVNAGLYDQQFAIEWVQKNIHLFGGDPTRVTIAGESAGGGSVMLQAMAYGGANGTSLFNNIIAASPYLPTQPNFDDEGPTRNYLLFAQNVGCYSGPVDGQQGTAQSSGAIFQCLSSKDSATLQNASNLVTSSVTFGQWAFIPVTDGDFVQQLPSVQFETGKLNGQRILTANNADEGVGFTPQNITTEANFIDWVQTLFPRFNSTQIQAVLNAYPSDGETVSGTGLNYSTSGLGPATALNESTYGSGQQQRANNLYAEATFICPSYWMADGYSRSNVTSAYHYQYSVIGADHGSDVDAYFGPEQPNISPTFAAGIMGIWYNMIVNDNPSIKGSNQTALENFPQWCTGPGARMIDLNETGGTPYTIESAGFINITQFQEPGIEVAFSNVDAWAWEGERGQRCQFLRGLAASVPE